jgi:CDP-glucose 4,6-dehydratase
MLSCFNGKTVLVTGHTGFKGSWLSAWLHSLGANVVGLSIDIPTSPSHFIVSNVEKYISDYRADVRDAGAVKFVVQKCQPDFVFHMAAQALVRTSYQTPLETIATNAMGTANVLDTLRFLEKPVVAVMITSDKAYDNLEWAWGYREIDRLGGKDPYSASKGMAELAIRTYVESFFNALDSNVRIGIARAGNVIGGGDWASDRIVSDCMVAWSRGEVVDIRSPNATRPWQHVLEPLSGYLALAAELAHRPDKHGEAYNFGPPAHQNHTVRALIDEMTKYWDNVRWNDVSLDRAHLHEANLLKLNCDKALVDLNWQSTLQFEDNVRMTIEWYRKFYQHTAQCNSNLSMDYLMSNFTLSQINEYTKFAQDRGRAWARK